MAINILMNEKSIEVFWGEKFITERENRGEIPKDSVKFIETLCKECWLHGYNVGQHTLKKDIKSLLGIYN